MVLQRPGQSQGLDIWEHWFGEPTKIHHTAPEPTPHRTSTFPRHRKAQSVKMVKKRKNKYASTRSTLLEALDRHAYRS
ncbi:hypothetical protein HYQ44_003648 [Verticillium longisporum]|nr:hypothetical protein HYQ44_003648 [Verticillium longisporum]